ncbi:hypothetical protein [Sinorhizobium sp. M4_45]|uniref:hypothetical protein n=1 Tax=Sinorhizobium sp. M4_45 TaxID=2037901 RepID=UPI0015E12743|nr:hypothetical protein [Sinorhizobium sp. M4_45]
MPKFFNGDQPSDISSRLGAIPFEPNQDGSTQGGELAYVGEVGTAFSRRMSTELRKLLEAIVAKKPLLTEAEQRDIYRAAAFCRSRISRLPMPQACE